MSCNGLINDLAALHFPSENGSAEQAATSSEMLRIADRADKALGDGIGRVDWLQSNLRADKEYGCRLERGEATRQAWRTSCEVEDGTAQYSIAFDPATKMPGRRESFLVEWQETPVNTGWLEPCRACVARVGPLPCLRQQSARACAGCAPRHRHPGRRSSPKWSDFPASHRRPQQPGSLEEE